MVVFTKLDQPYKGDLTLNESCGPIDKHLHQSCKDSVNLQFCVQSLISVFGIIRLIILFLYSITNVGIECSIKSPPALMSFNKHD
jgi:hypothetical protein